MKKEGLMEKIKMKCDRCGFVIDVHTADIKKTLAKEPFYRCPKCNIGSLKQVDSENKIDKTH